MSIGSLQSNLLVNPWAESAATQSGTSASWDAAAMSMCSGSQSSTGQITASNPLQNIASDIQAMLLQAQGTAATTATQAAGGSDSSSSVTPEQQLATDMQTLMNDPRGATSPNAQTASTNPTGQIQPHHHHHHHQDGGGDANGATSVADSSTTSGAATSGNDQAVAQIFASDITQALAAYGGDSGTTLMPGMVV